MKRAAQRQAPKLPHKPSSLRLGARRRDDMLTRIARAFAFMDGPQTFHPISWTPVRLLADGTTEHLPPDEAKSVMDRLSDLVVEVQR